MSADDEGLRWAGNWQVVRADLDLSHVFSPQDRISLTRNGTGYKVSHNSTAPDAHCFDGAVLTAVDGQEPSFADVSKDARLPLFSAHHKTKYRDLAQRIEDFVQKGAGMQRLEGTIQIPCHRYPHQNQESARGHHRVRTISTPIHIYRFANAVEENKRLFVIYKPLQAGCPDNGNGTVLGYDD